MIDGRLLVAAVAAWLGVAATVAGLGSIGSVAERHRAASAVVAAAIVLLTVGLVVATVVVGLRHRIARRPPPRVRLAGVALLLVVAGVAAGAWHVAAATGWPIGDWTAARVTAVVDAEVTGEPELHRPSAAQSWQSDWVEVRVATTQVSARGETVLVGVPLVVRVPADAVVPPPGSGVRVTGRLSMASAATTAAWLTSTSTHPFTVVDGPGRIDVIAHSMRLALRAAASSVSKDAGALVAGLATGDDSLQSPELAADMRASGLSHLTAVSGGNVAIVLAAVLALAAAVRASLAWRVSAGLTALAFFVVLVGSQPSVLRAAVMGSIVVLALLVGGRQPGPSVLGAAVLLLVLADPSLALSWGFGLSVMATSGLILLAPILDDRLATGSTRRWPPAIRKAIALTAAAQLATLPVLVAMGSTVSWVSLPANLFAMPAVAPVTVAGLLAAAVGPALPAVAEALVRLAALPAGWIAWVAHTAAAHTDPRLAWAAGPAGAAFSLAAIAAVVIGAAGLRHRFPGGVPVRARNVTAVALLPVLALWLLSPPTRRSWPPPGWFLVMCDVGQGDALVLRDGPASAVVVDAGPDPDLVDRCLDETGITSVSAVVLTHFHADHVDGLRGVFHGRSVGPVLVSPVRDPPAEAAAVDEVLAGLDHAVAEPIVAGDRRSTGDVDWIALWPRRRIEAGSIPNNASIVLAAHVAGHRVLLSGDIEPEAQAAIGPELTGLRFDVVKVPHHGSRYQDARLTTWAPATVALVSVGAANDYGHPAEETLAAWRAAGATVARTDRDGDVALVTVPGSSAVGVATRG